MDDTPVGELMTEPVLTVNPDDRIDEVGEAMLHQSIKSVVVIDSECRPQGILTSTDFIEIATKRADVTESTVEEWMTARTLTVESDASVRRAIEEMLSNGISHLPVVGADGGVVGILSMTDIVSGSAESVEASGVA